MFTWGSKYLFGVAVASLLGAAIYGLASGGGPIGVISLGYKGGIGEHTGYTTLVTIGTVTFLLGVLNVMTRDGDAEDGAAAVGVDQALSVSTPRTKSYWAPLSAFGVACLIVGVAVSQAFFILGLAVLAAVGLEWLVLVWSDRATGDMEVNETIRSRMLGPIEVPMLAMLGIAAIVLGLSRILLTVSEIGSTAVAALVAAAIFGAAIGISKADAPRSIIAGVIAISALFVLGGGIVAAVNGTRDIAHHTEPGAHDEGEPGGEGE